MAVIVDANAVLRLILSDNDEMVEEVKNLIRSRSVLLKNEVVAEIVYVLLRVYKVSREEICRSLMGLISIRNVHFESEDVMKVALLTFQEKNCDFVDSLLFAYDRIDHAEIFTFDKQLRRLIDNR
ncbi:MAG: PIN domain-containing protein [Peptococcaceae bacterium]|jgi:predicted nucleic-acid-binding protein|nr:PIN domain-containing protein [Peptococcaceae bacterium]